jgi:GntR family transcriptional regulator, galactonate operon transcriptional repressor
VGYPHRGRHGRLVQELGLGIVRGAHAPGDVLDLEGLEREFGVSRTVIREAVKVLASKGLLDSRQKLGTFVMDPARWNRLDPDVLRWRFATGDEPVLLDRLGEVRMMVEPAAAALAAERRSAEDIEAMAVALADMARHQTSGDTGAFVAADVRFHHAVLSATGNELVAGMALIIEVGLEVRDALVHAVQAPSAASVAAHRAVLDAIVSRQPADAQHRMRRLLEQASQDAHDVVAGVLRESEA